MKEKLPPLNELVWFSNTDGTTIWIGCRIETEDGSWLLAQSDNILYIENGKIQSQCYLDDLIDHATFWHKLPTPPTKSSLQLT